MHSDQIDRDWTVYDVNDEKVGDVAEVGAGYLLVQKGLLFIKDIYIPMGQVRDTDAASHRAYLDVSKDAIDGLGWDAPPTATDAGTVETTSATSTDRGYQTSDDAANGDASQRLRLHEEELQAQTRRERAGEVQVGKRVVEEQQEFDVPVTHEEVEIRRVPVDRDASAGDAAFTDDAQTIRVPVTAETVEVTKQPRVVEEIEISKRAVTTPHRVSDTVRREEADIDQEGDVVVGEGSDRDLVGSGADRTQRTSIDDIEDGDDAGTPRRDTGTW
jgi:uncharacterized protein (TIGR02271 family)